jgi:hypothetical protein
MVQSILASLGSVATPATVGFEARHLVLVVRESKIVHTKIETRKLRMTRITQARDHATKHRLRIPAIAQEEEDFTPRIRFTTHQTMNAGNGSLPFSCTQILMEGFMLLLIILVVLIFGFGYGGYRVGPGYGYYGGGGISLILVIVLILLLLKVI